jgi:hypothetical protein
MNIQDIENLLDKKLDTKLTEQRKEFERYVGAVLEQARAENKIGYEALGGRMDNMEEKFEARFDILEEKFDYMQELVAKNTEDIAEISMRTA